MPTTLPAAGPPLITAASLGTNAGLSAAVLFITNGLRFATGWSPRWLGLVVAIVLTMLVELLTEYQIDHNPLALLVAFCNSFVVYLSAVGGNSVLATMTGAANAGQVQVAPQPALPIVPARNFFDRWF